VLEELCGDHTALNFIGSGSSRSGMKDTPDTASRLVACETNVIP
jgi:hypothetical protein